MAKVSGLSKSLSSGKKKSSKSKKSSKKKIKHTHIEHGDDGSHVIRHMFDQGGPEEEPTPDAVHGVSDSSGLLSHLQGQFGGQLPQAGADAGGGAPAGPAPAGPPAGGM